MSKPIISIIGGGAAALSFASFIDGNKFNVSIYEQNKALGRKFLVAGKGGFNLTHAEAIEEIIKKYTPQQFTKAALESFTNKDFIAWLKQIGIPTFAGSSNRVYPQKYIKPIEVLKAIENIIKTNKVTINYNYKWLGWTDNNNLIFDSERVISSDISIFALGGGSWKVTGSDGNWLDLFSKKGISASPFEASNCGYKIEWPEQIVKKFEGKPLKNIEITCNEKMQKGEAILSSFGLEGNAIYGLSPQIREQLKTGKAEITIDFKPMLSEESVFEKLTSNKSKNITDCLKNQLSLSALQLALIKTYVSKEDFLIPENLSKKIKALPLKVTAAAKIDEAISTVGGINLDELTTHLECKQLPNTFCIGEMMNYDCPTGGYLLQGCFSMGHFVANHLNHLLK